MKRRGTFLVLATIGLIAASLPVLLRPSAAPAQAGGGALVYRVPVHGVIELGLSPFVQRSIDEAEAAGARAVVLDIETPGGRIDAAQQVVDAIRNAEVPVYAFVNRRAFSAGAMIALAADRIYMRTGGVMGAATPVTGEGQKAPEKIVSAMRSEMRALAEEAGLDPRVAEAMVDEEIEIEGLVEAGKLLTLTTAEAVRIGYAQEASDLNAMLADAGLAAASIQSTETNWAESVVRFLTHPVVAPILLSLGVLGLIIEIKTPSFGMAGLAGLGSLAAFFGSHYIVGLAGWEEVILLGIGLVLLLVEVLVLPGFGIAGVAGIAAIVGSVFLSLIGNFATGADMLQAAGILSLTIVVVVVAGWAVIRHLPRSGRFSRSGLMLGDATSRETGYLSAAVRAELVGATGVALTDLRPSGAARINDERIDVVAEADWIPAGTPVRVVRAEGYRHVVRPAE